MNDYNQTVAWWQSKQISTEAELSAAMSSHMVSFAYHSGHIENEQITYHDTREIFDHDGVTSYTGDLRTLFEIRNEKDASEHFLSAYGEGLPFNESLLLDLQKELTKNTYDTRRWQLGERPGTYKQHDYVIGKEETGAPPEDVAEEVAELMQELQQVDNRDALTAAAYFHAKFENIHAFADGNGRTGRLAMNYFLVIHDHPPVIIHQEDRKTYYDALEKWDTDQDLKPLISFLQEQTVKTWKNYASENKRAGRTVKTTLGMFL